MTTNQENPYRPPAEPEPEAGALVAPYVMPQEIQYVPGGGRAKATIALLYLSFGLGVVGVIVSVLTPGAMDAVEQGSDEPGRLLFMALAGLFALLTAVAAVATGVCFCLWFHRAYTNVQIVFRVQGLRNSPGWAVGGFFIPLANLVIPHTCGREIWLGSHPGVERIDDASASRVGAGIVALWWCLFLVMNLSSTLGGMIQNQDPASGAAVLLLVLSDLATVTGALVAIRMIRRVEHNQGERAAQLTLDPSPPPTTKVEGSRPRCQHCGWSYDPRDYAVDAAHIYCARCKGELPREP